MEKKQEVWVIYGTQWGCEEGEDSEGVCLGVFSTEEKARIYLKKHPYNYGDVDIVEIEIDEENGV